MPRSAAAPVISLCACLCAGCFDDSSSIVSVPTRSLLTVDPAVFLGDVQCGAPELRRYVVTVTDISAVPPTQAVSAPTDCTTKVSFAAPPLVRDHFFTATIDGYDRDDVTPSGDGSAAVIDPTTMQIVPKRWTTTCGTSPTPNDAGQTGAQSFDGSANPILSPTPLLEATEVFLSGCLPLQAVSSTGPSGPPDASGDTSGEADGGSE